MARLVAPKNLIANEIHSQSWRGVGAGDGNAIDNTIDGDDDEDPKMPTDETQWPLLD